MGTKKPQKAASGRFKGPLSINMIWLSFYLTFVVLHKTSCYCKSKTASLITLLAVEILSTYWYATIIVEVGAGSYLFFLTLLCLVYAVVDAAQLLTYFADLDETSFNF